MSKQIVSVKRGQAVFFTLRGQSVLGQVLAGNTRKGVAIRNVNTGYVCNVPRSRIVSIASTPTVQ